MGGSQHKQDSDSRSSLTTTQGGDREPFEFGAALREMASSMRKRLADVSLAAALPLAAAGFAGISSASEQTNQNVPAKVAPGHVEHRPSVQTLSEDDAKAVITNFKKPVGTSGPIESLLADHYEARQPRVIHNDSYGWVRKLSGKEALAMLRTISEGKQDRFGEEAARLLSEVDEMLASPIFQKGVDTIRETNAACKAPMGEMSAVWSLPEADIEQFLHILRSPGFQAYQQSVHAATGVDLQSRLLVVVAEYTAYSTDRSQAVGPELKPALEHLKAKIPELPLLDIGDLRQVQLRVNEQENEPSSREERESLGDWLQKVQRAFEILGTQYSVKVQSLADLNERVIDEETQSYLQREDVKELSRYLATTYPNLDVGRSWPSKFVIHDDGFLRGFARPIVGELHTDGPTMRRFLALYGKDLGEVDLSNVGPHLMRSNLMAIDKLVESRTFTEFLDQEFEKYPSLQSALTAEQIFQLSAAFAHREDYEELNSKLAKRAVGGLPDLSLHSVESKCTLLETLEDCGFEGLTVGRVDRNSWDIHDLNGAIEALRTPQARRLYDAICNRWGLEKFDVADFCDILTGPTDARNFLLDEENSRRFADIRKLYPLSSEYAAGVDNLSDLSRYAPSVVSNEHVLLRQELAAYLRRYDDRLFKEGPYGDRTTCLYDLAQISTQRSSVIENLEKFQAAARLLEERYGAEPLIAGKILRGTHNIDRQLEKLRSLSVISLFYSLDGAFLDTVGLGAIREPFRESLSLESRLELAMRISSAEGIQATIQQVCAAGGKVTTGDSLAYLIQECYDNAAVRSALNDPTFVKFVRELDQRFFSGTVNYARFREYEELYTELKDEPGALQALFSPEFSQLTSFLGQQFQVATEQASTLRPSLRVSKDLDLADFVELTQQLRGQGEPISPNDIVFLSEISKDPNLRARLSDRHALLEGLRQVYDRVAFPRRSLDQLRTILEPSQDADEERRNKVTEARNAIMAAYTERPPLSDISTMQLLRLTLIDEMLRREDVKATLGSLIAKDIATKTTELGGAILLEKGRASLREHASSSHSDGYFSTYKYNKFVDGLATFHLHALHIDESDYTGPSGWLGLSVADVGFVDRFNATDVVFTVMGHPSDEEENPVQSKVRVNADVYFVDKRDPRNPVLKIIDLGEVVVPYEPSTH